MTTRRCEEKDLTTFALGSQRLAKYVEEKKKLLEDFSNKNLLIFHEVKDRSANKNINKIQNSKIQKNKTTHFFLKKNPFQLFYKSLKYSLAEGKKIRPILFFLILDSFCGYVIKKNSSKFLDIGLAIELIHTYSLIHDDLPSMDNDDFRRGRPSLHKIFPEWMALLAGDFLLTKSFELLSSSKLPDNKKIKIIKLFAKRCGLFGMIGGQIIDMEYKNKKMDKELLEPLLLKTTSLFLLSAEVALIILDRKESWLKKAVIDFGIAYQLLDDLADKEPSFTNIVTLYGEEKAKHLLDNHKKNIEKAFSTKNDKKFNLLKEFFRFNKT